MGRIANADAVQSLRPRLGGPEPLRTAVGKACLTAAEARLANGKQEEASGLLDLLREADLPKYLHVAALQGAIRARG